MLVAEALAPILPAALPAAIIVAGPTCSGKSALAMELAARHNGTVINADSMQVYRELRIVTARPTPADEARVPHALYGVLPAAETGSVAWWRTAALDAMQAAMTAGRLPVLCGGTGLYLAALCRGLTDMPPVNPEARHEARHLLATEGAPALHAKLAAVDPGTAAGLRPNDPQRVARAWEVWRGTGRGLASWQGTPGPPAPYDFRMVLLDPPRSTLRDAIARRFATMLEDGALAEVAALDAQGLDPALPAMRAHGVPELRDALHRRATLDEAARRAILSTGQYLKRQATWLRHRPPVDANATHTIHARFAGPQQFSEREWCDIDSFIRRGGEEHGS